MQNPHAIAASVTLGTLAVVGTCFVVGVLVHPMAGVVLGCATFLYIGIYSVSS